MEDLLSLCEGEYAYTSTCIVHYKFIALSLLQDASSYKSKYSAYPILRPSPETITTNGKPNQSFSLKSFLRDKRIRDYKEVQEERKFVERKISSSMTFITLKMASTNNGIQQKPAVGGQPCLTLVPVVKSNVDETELVQFTLKVQAGSAGSAPTYKRKVARFNSGTPAEWIAVLEELKEIFAQNGVEAAVDQENVICTILRGDSWTAFESSIQESRVNEENRVVQLPLTVLMVDNALKAVTDDVFPHRALVNHQLNWMKRHMRRPATMSVRQYVASVTQMNGHWSISRE
ncbi:hypothetical protein G9A89_000356 [Geosiphon pyriformis]|nr:hypothetical protein G9A89_000356 [Geosiphon pyriformis]